MFDLEKDPLTLRVEECKARYTNLSKELEESNSKILDLLEINKKLNKRNDELNEMNILLLKEVIDDKNRFIEILEQKK